MMSQVFTTFLSINCLYPKHDETSLMGIVTESGFCVILVRLRPFGVNLHHFYATLCHIASQTSSSTFPPSLYNLAVSFKAEKITKKVAFL
jgi:hypothetical protein